MKLKQTFSKNASRWAITDKMFLSLMITGAIVEFSEVGAGFIDGLIISRFIGADAMAAQGIAQPIFSILGVVSGLLAVGMQVRCSQAIGKGIRKDFCRFFSATVYVGLAISFILTVLLIAFAKPFAVMLGANGNAAELADITAQYLLGVGFGVPPLIMAAILAPALQLDSGGKRVRTGALIGASVNVLLDLITVRLELGLFGIGLATAISFYLNLAYQSTFFLKKDRALRFVKPDIPVKEFFVMLTNGGEKAIKRLANTLRPIVLNAIIISYGGTVAMTVLSTRNNFSSFAEIFGAGIASAVSLLTGVFYGEINQDAIEEVSKYKNKMVLLFSGSIGFLTFIFARPLAGIYVSGDEELLNMVVFAFRMLALQILLLAMISCRIKYLQAIHRKSNMNMLIIETRVVLILILAFVLGKLFGVYGILASYTVSDAITLLSIYIYYAVKHRKIMPDRLDYLNLPDNFTINPGNVIDLDIRSKEDVSLASEQITLFCKGHKIDRRVAYYSALAFEELASNIVQHGFPNVKTSESMIDLRAVITDDTFVIRLRDYCPMYDVTKQIAAVNESEDDSLSSFGIRIVSAIASDITYLNTFDTNTLIIKFSLNNASENKQ